MRRTIRCLVPACFLTLVLGATPAAAVVLDRDTGYDARDIDTESRFDPDIKSTTRKLSTHDGRRVLAIVVRFYERVAGWPLEVRLDANGGPRVDHIISTFGEECYVWPKGHRSEGVPGRASARGDRFVCRVPARTVSPSKSIRWKVHTRPPEDSAPHGSTFEIDYAPSDRGWYG
ncbi:MAG: hypothetical protein ACXWXN_11220 [Actinomycetota bacterium]